MLRRSPLHTTYSATYAGGEVQVWLALQPGEEAFPRETHPFLVVGRLAPGASVDAARQELTAIAAELEKSYPENRARGVNVEPYTEVVFGESRAPLMVLLGAAALVLLVACADVANLLLARMTVRRRELAVRTALGAQGSRIGLQLLTESLAAVAFGMLPVMQARRADIRSALQEGGGNRIPETRGARRFRGALVVSEVALAVALVIGAGLLLRSFQELRGVDPGFRTANVLKAEYQLPATRYPLDYSRWPDLPEINRFHAELLRQVQALPGVESAALAGVDPLDPGITNSFGIVGRPEESEALPEIRTRFITPSYLETMGVPLSAGRAFRDGDVAGSARGSRSDRWRRCSAPVCCRASSTGSRAPTSSPTSP